MRRQLHGFAEMWCLEQCDQGESSSFCVHSVWTEPGNGRSVRPASGPETDTVTVRLESTVTDE